MNSGGLAQLFTVSFSVLQCEVHRVVAGTGLISQRRKSILGSNPSPRTTKVTVNENRTRRTIQIKMAVRLFCH